MPKITVSRAGNTITVSDGKRTRLSSCASLASAKAQEARFKNDPEYAARWLRAFEPVQLALPLAPTDATTT